MKEHALIYLGESKAKENAIIQLLHNYDFAYTLLDDDDLSSSIITLFEKDKVTNKTNNAFAFNFIFFKNIDHDKILAFYKDCQTQGFAFSHKAVMTEHNQSWILQDLLKEIAEEHEFFQMYNTLKQLLKDANEMDPNDYSEVSFTPYRNAFIKAFMYIKQQQLDKEEMQTLIKEVIDTKANIVKKDD